MQPLPVVEDERIEVDEGAQPVGHAVGDAGDDAAAIGVAAEHDLVELFPTNEVDDVGDVRVEVHLR